MPMQEEELFCCSGCEYVYRIIQDESLERFYDLRGSVSRPVGSRVFLSADFNWLEPLVEAAESEKEQPSLTLGLEGVSCVGCVWLVDHLFNQREGGVYCRVNVQYGTFEVSWERGKLDLLSFAQQLSRFGYRVCPTRSAAESETKQVGWRLGLAGAFALNGMLYTLPGYLGMESSFAFAMHFTWLSAIFATLSFVFCGSYFMVKAFKAALQGVTHLDLPISVGIVLAYSTSWYGILSGDENLVYFDFVTTFLFLMLGGRWLQVVAIERNRNLLTDIMLEMPEVKIETSSGDRARASSDQLKRGARYWLDPGQRVPVRSALQSPRASIGMDWISGESESRVIERYEEAPSGASLENRYPVALEALEDWDQSLLAKLARKSPRSLERDTAAQKWISRYMIAAFLVAFAGGFAWLASGEPLTGLSVFIAVLVVSCPCAIGIAWPFADEIALARLRRIGVFVTTHSLWNRLTRVRKIVFDKTGTLTRSNLTLRNPEVIERLDRESLEALCCCCADSRHPVSRTLREMLMARGRFRPLMNGTVRETIGEGIECSAGGQVWRLGKLAWASEGTEASEGTGFAQNGKALCEFQLEDLPLADSSLEIENLSSLGLELAILSGDTQEKAHKVGSLVGMKKSTVFGNMLPEDKADWLKHNDGSFSMMVGDGANDTLAFGQALCCGAPANEQGMVADKADFHYLGNGIQGIRNVLRMGGIRKRAMKAALGFALIYNIVAVGFALAGLMTPLLAAVAMPISSILSLAIVWGVLGRTTTTS